MKIAFFVVQFDDESDCVAVSLRTRNAVDEHNDRTRRGDLLIEEAELP